MNNKVLFGRLAKMIAVPVSRAPLVVLALSCALPACKVLEEDPPQTPELLQLERSASLGNNGPADATKGSEVSLEISGTIDIGQPDNSQVPVEISFREKIPLFQSKTIRLVPVSEKGLKSELTEGKSPKKNEPSSTFLIEITPLQFYTDSVKLQLEVFAKNAGGRIVSLAKPVIVAPFGESSEISELNTSAEAQYAGLRFSFFPQSTKPLSK